MLLWGARIDYSAWFTFIGSVGYYYLYRITITCSSQSLFCHISCWWMALWGARAPIQLCCAGLAIDKTHSNTTLAVDTDDPSTNTTDAGDTFCLWTGLRLDTGIAIILLTSRLMELRQYVPSMCQTHDSTCRNLEVGPGLASLCHMELLHVSSVQVEWKAYHSMSHASVNHKSPSNCWCFEFNEDLASTGWKALLTDF